MEAHETSTFESEPSHQASAGGAAPAERRCRYDKADGSPCHNWAIRGQDYCHKHGIFLRARLERPIEVPLLEDEAAIVLLLSETMRALAWGTIPVSNGRMLLDGCRFAHKMQCQRLEEAKLRFKVRRAGIPAEEIFPRPGVEESREAGAGVPNPEPVAPTPEPDAPKPEPAEESAEQPLTTPLLEPPDQRYHCFRDLKKDWDKDLLKMENEMGDMVARRHGETREEFRAARVKPFDHLAEIDAEVARAHALAAAAAATAPEPASIAANN